jgi:uncharacterized protein (DUF58 family)
MVRQEERPWQGQMTVLLDTRTGAHMSGPMTPASEADERLHSSFEWAVSAAATVASFGVFNNREVGLITDLTTPARLPMLTPDQVGDHLALVRSNARTSLETLSELLPAIARESTLIAVLGELDSASLRVLASVHPRATATNAMAMLLDVGTWRDGLDAGLDGTASVVNSRVQNAARVLRAAGWQAHVVRCGDSVAGAVQTLLAPRATSSALSELAGYAGRR